MCETSHSSSFINYTHKHSGFSLAAALFIIVVLGLFAAALFRMTQTANLGVAQEVLSIRALYAAESGAQASAMNLFPISGAAGVCNANTYTFSQPGLEGCTATVSCNEISVNGESLYEMLSQSQCGSGENTASRTVEVLLRNL